MAKKNPHDPQTPEWQLWEQMKTAESLISVYTADSERYIAKAAAERKKAEMYREALDKLIG